MSTANDVLSLMASVIRGGRGLKAQPRARSEEPEQPLELFEFEA